MVAQAISGPFDLCSILDWTRARPWSSLVTVLILWITYKLVLKPLLSPSPYRHLPAPKKNSYLFGQRIIEEKGFNYTAEDGTVKTISGPGEVSMHWARTLDTGVFVYAEPFGRESLFFCDPHAINAILSDIDKFQSDLMRSKVIEFIIGDGIVARYGNAHRKQRKLMNPAFTPAHVKHLTPIFCRFADQLCQKIDQSIGGESNVASVELGEWLDCATLDIIGMAGFNYSCMGLEKGRNGSELSAAFHSVIQSALDFGLSRVIHLALSAMLYPPASNWPISKGNRRIAKMNRFINRLTLHIVETARLKIQQEGNDLRDNKDLLSLLIKSNLDVGAAERMTDKEISGQIQTFLFAGYETSSVTTSWLLYYLACNPRIQDKLRTSISETLKERKGISIEEVRADDLGYDDIWCDELQYLHWTLMETLRMCPPVPLNDREAMEDAVLPLMTPITTKDGRQVDRVVVKKGTRVIIGVKAANCDSRLFGADADKFRPERWEELPEAHARAKFPPYGVYSFIGGPKTCIGARFALTEIKALVILLLRNFEFTPEPGVEISELMGVVTRPHANIDGKMSAGLPLRVTRIHNH